jgi:hypothetical protein
MFFRKLAAARLALVAITAIFFSVQAAGESNESA